MQKIICFVSIASIFLPAWGQSPDWKVSEQDFEHTMSLVAFVNVDGRTLTGSGDRVAAFVNGECRGVAGLTEVSSHQEHLAYLTVFGNTNNEVVSFKIYDATADRVVDVAQQLVFRINAHEGNLLQPFSIAQPALSAAASITEISLAGLEPLNVKVADQKVVFLVEKDTPISAHTLLFTLTAGATLFWNNQPVISGENLLDFSLPVSLQLRSEDRSVIRSWTVAIEFASELLVYRRNATCFEAGAIKVTGSSDGQPVSLIRSGQVISSRSMTGGEVLFDRLVPGTYTVQTTAFEKLVIIEQP
ncbi:hypothetical protein [Cyclobacterium xiamenense]|uniref:hypothetical protein n=1 Tax=Cyclobacterium xiamenense TaxID=1297121 RepID=UPI0012B8638E|nr:hypothetical protein [Cyclobacterium xiamenense]